MRNNANAMKKMFGEDKSRMYRRQLFRKAVEQMLVSEKPKITQNIANKGRIGKRKLGKAGLQFAATTEAILRSRDFWAGIAASSIAGMASSMASTAIRTAIENRRAKKVEGTTAPLPKEVADTSVPDEYSQYIG